MLDDERLSNTTPLSLIKDRLENILKDFREGFSFFSLCTNPCFIPQDNRDLWIFQVTNGGTFALPEELFRRRHPPLLGESLATERQVCKLTEALHVTSNETSKPSADKLIS